MTLWAEIKIPNRRGGEWCDIRTKDLTHENGRSFDLDMINRAIEDGFDPWEMGLPVYKKGLVPIRGPYPHDRVVHVRPVNLTLCPACAKKVSQVFCEISGLCRYPHEVKYLEAVMHLDPWHKNGYERLLRAYLDRGDHRSARQTALHWARIDSDLPWEARCWLARWWQFWKK